MHWSHFTVKHMQKSKRMQKSSWVFSLLYCPAWFWTFLSFRDLLKQGSIYLVHVSELWEVQSKSNFPPSEESEEVKPDTIWRETSQNLTKVWKMTTILCSKIEFFLICCSSNIFVTLEVGNNSFSAAFENQTKSSNLKKRKMIGWPWQYLAFD